MSAIAMHQPYIEILNRMQTGYILRYKSSEMHKYLQ